MTDWTLDRSRQLYGIDNWSGGYFTVNEAGHVAMRARRDAAPAVDLYRLAGELREEQGLRLPALVRFEDVLHDRVDTLCSAFDQAMDEVDYRGGYTAVYPIKVNQQRSVVAQILAHGGSRVGLEAGSKPELLAVLALARPGGVIVCNGYKDREYLRLALLGRLLGQRIYIVVEKPSELELVIQEARDLGVRPLLGMRVRLASIGAGKWQNTGGEKAKFGLSAAQALRLLHRLREEDMLDCMGLLHFHMGSQIANIRDIQRGMREAARFYQELRRLGADIRVVDVGGGLGIDYEGTRSRHYCSMNYSVQEYARNIVRTLHETCEEHGLPHPEVFTESGRAMTAHHAVLITNVTDIERLGMDEPAPPTESGEPAILQDLWALYENAGGVSPTEVYHDAAHWLTEAQSMYAHGVFTLEQRARAEELYFAICRRLLEGMEGQSRVQREIRDELNEKLADKYFCNFSVFQSIPDVWAIEQIFPIMPLNRLEQRPTRRAVLQDLTCDSDGRIDRYVEDDGIEPTLPLHAVGPEEDYLIGIFLVGAYQEILGDLHNLFGDTDSINVALTDDGYRLVEPEYGDTVDELLRYVHFDTDALLAALKDKVDALAIDADKRQLLVEELKAGLEGYTYLED
ncbi:MAG: biosynthetic arginine decarboxylase [Chromatiales bacterium]|nr:biosynthetic arginine decarboxylase [Chromatiales bacterium]